MSAIALTQRKLSSLGVKFIHFLLYIIEVFNIFISRQYHTGVKLSIAISVDNFLSSVTLFSEER